MTTELFLRYIHFVSIFIIAGALLTEHLLLKARLTRKEIDVLSRIDGGYGMAALSLLGAGLTLWLGGYGKPSEFYTHNSIFHVKLTLFILIGLLSIYPTVFFIKNRKGEPEDFVTVPRSIFWLLRMELLLLAIIPLLAGMMAKGIGYWG